MLPVPRGGGRCGYVPSQSAQEIADELKEEAGTLIISAFHALYVDNSVGLRPDVQPLLFEVCFLMMYSAHENRHLGGWVSASFAVKLIGL